jgi:hypothetical protein
LVGTAPRLGPALGPALLRTTVVSGLLLLGTAAHAGGLMRITSDGDGGRIYVDGADTGQLSPATFDDVPLGKHVIEIVGGCSRGSTTINVGGTGLNQADVKMTLGGGTLVVKPTPSNAVITVDGAPVTPGAASPVSCGSHVVNITLDGHLPAVLSLDVGLDDLVELPVTLAKLGSATLTVNVTPDNSTVLLDGLEIATGSVPNRQVVAGPHVLRVEADGYVPAERQFQLADGAARQFVLALDRDVAPVAKKTGRGGRVTGWGLTAVGIGALGYAGWQGLRTVGEYDSYQDDVEDGDFDDQDDADDAYDDRISPLKTGMYASLGAGGALLASGVTLLIVF